MNVRVFAEAKTEISEAADYYEQQQNGLGRAFIEATHVAITQIQTMPQIGACIYKKARRVLLKRFPYAVIYTVHHNEIIVISVMHQHRHPDYWKSRLPY